MLSCLDSSDPRGSTWGRCQREVILVGQVSGGGKPGSVGLFIFHRRLHDMEGSKRRERGEKGFRKMESVKIKVSCWESCSGRLQGLVANVVA